jgi:hypothetical protein
LREQIEKCGYPLKLANVSIEESSRQRTARSNKEITSMKKLATTALVLLLAAGCASTPMASNESGGAPSVSGITSNPRNAPDYVLLSAPNQVRTYDFSNAIGVRGLHIRGTMTNKGFYPAGEIQGSGKFCADGKDWLSLSELKVHTASEGKAPVAPYILGCASGTTFQPASRAIVAQ